MGHHDGPRKHHCRLLPADWESHSAWHGSVLPKGAKVFCKAGIYTVEFGVTPIAQSVCAWCECEWGQPCGFSTRCLASNRHSVVAASTQFGTRRGFLPRGLYDAHPLLVTWHHWIGCTGGHPTNLNYCGHWCTLMFATKKPYFGDYLPRNFYEASIRRALPVWSHSL